MVAVTGADCCEVVDGRVHIGGCGMKRRECELDDVGLELMLAVGVISSMAGCHEEERG